MTGVVLEMHGQSFVSFLVDVQEKEQEEKQKAPAAPAAVVSAPASKSKACRLFDFAIRDEITLLNICV